jgi:ketosteroid isomerase-like protein
MHRFHLFLLAILILFPVGASPQSSRTANDTEQLIAAEQAWAKSATTRDIARMAAFMADDFVELTLANDPATKQLRWKNTSKSEWLGLLQSGEEKYDSIELRNLKVYLHGDVATVTGEYTQKGTRGAEDISATGVYVDTWVKTKGTWQVVNSVFP